MGLTKDIEQRIQLALKGDKASISRLISLVERGGEASHAIVEQIYPHTGNAVYIGITGPPGAGKSTLVNRLVESFCNNRYSVGVIAVDPSSPYTGGALLGDRLRMKCKQDHRDCFFRSMSTGTVMGGLGRRTKEASWIFDACGIDVVIIETVGVGQSECDIMTAVDTVVVVLTPESGDSIQVMKAGLLEIADVFVINKSDRPGAEDIGLAVDSMLDRKERISGEMAWRPPILRTSADRGAGISDLYEKIIGHHRRTGARSVQSEKRQARYADEFVNGIKERLIERFMDDVFKADVVAGLVGKCSRQKLYPKSAARKIVDELLSGHCVARDRRKGCPLCRPPPPRPEAVITGGRSGDALPFLRRGKRLKNRYGDFHGAPRATDAEGGASFGARRRPAALPPLTNL